MTERTEPTPSDHPAGRQQGEAPPFWEWVTAGVGAVLLVSAVAYLLFEAEGVAKQPAQPEVELLSIVAQGDHHAAKVRVHNHGRSAAAQLRLSGRVVEQGREVERSDTEFDFVPPESRREAVLLFAQDPRGRLQLRVESYQPP